MAMFFQSATLPAVEGVIQSNLPPKQAAMTADGPTGKPRARPSHRAWSAPLGPSQSQCNGATKVAPSLMS